MHLRRDDEKKWEKLDKALDGKKTMKKSMTIKDGASSAVKPRNAGKNKGISKALAILAVQNPTMYKMLVERLKKAKPFAKPEEKPEEEKPASEKPEEKPADGAPEEEKKPAEGKDEVSSEAQTPQENTDASATEDKPEAPSEPATEDTTTEVAPGTPEHQVVQPDATMAQPNTQESEDQKHQLEAEIQSLEAALGEIQALTHEQGLLSEQELEEIIIPLQEELSRLSELIKPNDDYRQYPKEQNGPRRYSGSVERSLEAPSSSWVERNSKQGDISKGRGWHGDPDGHAEAARDRWSQEGVSPGGNKQPSAPSQPGQPQKPKKPGLGDAAAKELQRAARKAGRVITDTTVDVISDVGLQAAGTIAGILLYRYLQAKPIHPKALAALALSSTKRGVKHLMNTRRLKQLRTADNLARLRRKASIANIVLGGSRRAPRVVRPR